MLLSSRDQRMPREDAGQLPALFLDQGSLPSGHQEARVGDRGLRLAQQPRVSRFVFLLLVSAGVVLCCLGVLLSSLVSAPEVPSVLAGTNVEHVHRGADAPAPLPDASYLLTPAEEAQQTDKHPVNAYLLTMLLLACASGASVLRMLRTNARRQGATCSWSGDDRPWLTVAHEAPSFLGVFRL
jgi:hypothetical protein